MLRWDRGNRPRVSNRLREREEVDYLADRRGIDLSGMRTHGAEPGFHLCGLQSRQNRASIRVQLRREFRMRGRHLLLQLAYPYGAESGHLERLLDSLSWRQNQLHDGDRIRKEGRDRIRRDAL